MQGGGRRLRGYEVYRDEQTRGKEEWACVRGMGLGRKGLRWTASPRFRMQCALGHICQGRLVANGPSKGRVRIRRAPSSSLVGNPKSVQTVSPWSPPLWGSEEAALTVCLAFSPPLDLLSTKPWQLMGHFEPEPWRPGSATLKALFSGRHWPRPAHSRFCSD